MRKQGNLMLTVIRVFTAVTVLAFTIPAFGQSAGTGIIVDSRGYILTAAHGLTGHELGKRKIEVFVNSRTYVAQVLKIDVVHDLVLIKIDEHSLPVAKLGSSEEIERTEKVWAIGYPADGMNINTLTGKLVEIHKNESLKYSNDQILRAEKIIRTNLPFAPGFSGGPLLNRHAQVIGVVLADAGEHGGFSIPVELANTLLEKIPGYNKTSLGKAGKVRSEHEIRAAVSPAVVKIKVMTKEVSIASMLKNPSVYDGSVVRVCGRVGGITMPMNPRFDFAFTLLHDDPITVMLDFASLLGNPPGKISKGIVFVVDGVFVDLGDDEQYVDARKIIRVEQC